MRKTRFLTSGMTAERVALDLLGTLSDALRLADPAKEQNQIREGKRLRPDEF
jgi:hypothetical protein